MFSANSDEIVDVVERGVGRYQMALRPSLYGPLTKMPLLRYVGQPAAE